MSSVEYNIYKDKFHLIVDGTTLEIGDKVSFLFDYDTGQVLKHGFPDIVNICMSNMIKCLTLASIDFTDKDFIKEVCNMKDALTLVEIKVGEIDIDKINMFVNNSGYIKQWFTNERT